jgi:hypothetical protein
MPLVKHLEVPLPENVDCDTAAGAIDEAIDSVGLTTTLRGSLKKYSGCVHWHAKLGRASGTLEITFWPDEQRAWFSVQSGRQAEWIEEKLPLLKSAIQKQLSSAR